jgi:hypothetical protein
MFWVRFHIEEKKGAVAVPKTFEAIPCHAWINFAADGIGCPCKSLVCDVRITIVYYYLLAG